MNELSFIFYFNFFVLILASLACIVQWTVQKAVYASFLLSLAGMQGVWGLLKAGLLPDYPDAYVLVMPIMFLYMPTLYYSLLFVLTDKLKLEWQDIWHLLPFTATFLVMVPFLHLPFESKQTAIANVLAGGGLVPELEYYFSGDLLTLACFSIAARMIYWLWIWQSIGIHRSKFPRGLYAGLRSMAFINVLLCPVMAVGVIQDSQNLFYGTLFAGAVTIIVLFVLIQIYPLMGKNITAIKNEGTSKLVNLDVGQIENKIQRLASLHRFYESKELSLTKMAELLEITPHQLSEYLNKVKGTNFNAFVNSYRVAAAKEKLLAEDIYSTYAVGAEVGFGSRSTFHNVFRQQTGYTPKRFRQKYASSR